MSKSIQGPAAAVSRHDDHGDDLPPAYSGPIAPLVDDSIPPATPGQQGGIPGLPNLQFANYAPLQSTLSQDLSTVTVHDAALVASAHSFASFIRQQVALPPKIEIVVIGTHKTHGNGTDFNFHLSMLPYFVPRDGRPGLNYVAIPKEGKAVSQQSTSARDIDDCARAFVSDKSWPRSFTINRKVVNYDTDYLRGVIHGLAAIINYKGTVKVKIVQTHAKTVFQAPKPPNTSAFAAGIRSVFTAPKNVDIDTVWPYADKPVQEEDDTAGAAQRRTCLVRSERGWWQDWKGLIRDAMLTKRTGRLGVDDFIDFASDPAARARKVPESWGEDAY